jgi:hypothetical protein
MRSKGQGYVSDNEADDEDQEDTNDLLRKAANAGKDQVESYTASKNQTPMKSPSKPVVHHHEDRKVND